MLRTSLTVLSTHAEGLLASLTVLSTHAEGAAGLLTVRFAESAEIARGARSRRRGVHLRCQLPAAPAAADLSLLGEQEIARRLRRGVGEVQKSSEEFLRASDMPRARRQSRLPNLTRI